MTRHRGRKEPTDVTLYRIRDWNERFENNRTRELKTLTRVLVPNSQDGSGYSELLDHPDGPAHYGCWIACLLVASKCDPRGTLLRGTRKPHTNRSIARSSHFPVEVVDAAIPRLIELGWIEAVPFEESALASNPPPMSHNGAGLSHPSAAPSRIKGNYDDSDSDDSDTDTPSAFERVSRETLQSNSRLRKWFDWASRLDAPIVDGTPACWMKTVAIAERCLQKAAKPAALFARIIGKQQWTQATPRYMKQAKLRLLKEPVDA